MVKSDDECCDGDSSLSAVKVGERQKGWLSQFTSMLEKTEGEKDGGCRNHICEAFEIVLQTSGQDLSS